MPYIEQAVKKVFDRVLNTIETEANPASPGALNYLITKIVLLYLGDNPSYNDYNDITGVLECAKLEFYRRAISSYEDKKIKENGDVYD